MTAPYSPPEGNKVALAFEDSAYAPPPGNKVRLEFVRAAGGSGESQYVVISGIAADGYGQLLIRLQWRLLAPAGFAASACGAPLVFNYTQYLLPRGPLTSLLPDARVYNFVQYIGQAGNLPSKTQWGKPTAYNRNRIVSLKDQGFAADAYGKPYMAGGLLKVTVGGIAAPAWASVDHWTSHSPRLIEHGGYYATRIGVQMVGSSRNIWPSGFEATAWGSRIVPPSRTLAPIGFMVDPGTPTVINRNRRILVPSTLTNGDLALRWGTLRLVNLRQYISNAPLHESGDSLDGEKWSRWTKVENRDRYIAHHSVAPSTDQVMRPTILNKAVPLYPAGIPSADPAPWQKSGQVAPAIRAFFMDGIEAPGIGRWHAVGMYRPEPMAPTGIPAPSIPRPALENTRRSFPLDSGFDGASLGEPFVAYRIREILCEDERYGIAPPYIRMPDVQHYTRYIAPKPAESGWIGWHDLVIYRATFTPRWSAEPQWGWPALKNLTPEVPIFGHDSAEFGAPFVRLEWRPVTAAGGSPMQAMGRPHIADRRRWIAPPGVNYLRLGDRVKVDLIGGYTPPAVKRVLPTGLQAGTFPSPVVGSKSVTGAGGIAAPYADAPQVRLMGAIVQSILKEDSFGWPLVWEPFKKQFIAPGGIALSDQRYGKPRVTPHTVYAVLEAPVQAMANHPTGTLHPVSDGAKYGRPDVQHRHRWLRPATGGDQAGAGRPTVYNMKQHVRCQGFRAFRAGYQWLLGGISVLEQYLSDEFMVIGHPRVGDPNAEIPDNTIKPHGFNAHNPHPPGFDQLKMEVMHFHRELPLQGWDSLAMGSSRPGSLLYPQSLDVGPRRASRQRGDDLALYGTPWVSFAVRDLWVPGTDFFISEYDPQRFDWRMRVRLRSIPPPFEALPQVIAAIGVEPGTGLGIAEAWLWHQFIRPDGNADQFRKGGL